MAREIADGARIVEAGDGLVALAPYASRSAFETWILPERHDARFEDAPEAARRAAGRMLTSVLHRIDRVAGEPPFNLVVHTAPFQSDAAAWYHWHLIVIPRLTMVGGFEWGSGMHINPTAPEDAAELLRAARR